MTDNLLALTKRAFQNVKKDNSVAAASLYQVKNNRLWEGEYKTFADFVHKNKVPLGNCFVCGDEISWEERTISNMSFTCSKSCYGKLVEQTRSKKTERYTCQKCKKPRLPSKTKTGMCYGCFNTERLLKRRPDIENIGKCLDCKKEIARMSYRCVPCEGLRSRMNEKQLLNRRLANSARARIVKVLRQNLRGKLTTTSRYLDCSIDELKKHLESKFQEGMTWENYGFYGWHIDHILPCASFDLSELEQQKKCFHYTNLQPLWAKENMQKKDKIL